MSDTPSLPPVNATLGNVDVHWSDRLPPAFVKDWRQFLRSRGFVVLFLLLQLAGWFFVLKAGFSDERDAVADTGDTLLLLGAFALCLALPYRAGSTVSADTRVRGANFLMLTPLSARRIVWGTWSSTAAQILLAALLALPLLYVRQGMIADAAGLGWGALDWGALWENARILSGLTLVGWVMTALFMFTAGLAPFFRIGLFIAACVFGIGQAAQWMFLYVYSRASGQFSLDSIVSDAAAPFVAVDALLLLLLFLELARRHYAAPAENCSAAVRLLAPLPLLLYAGLAIFYEPVDPVDALSATAEAAEKGASLLDVLEGQGKFASRYLLGAILCDALLPTFAMPVHARRAWRGLPAILQVPGLLPSTLCCLIATALAALPDMLALHDPLRALWTEGEAPVYACFAALPWINVAYTALVALLLTDCFCARGNQNRPVLFAALYLVLSVVMQLAAALATHGNLEAPSAAALEMALPVSGNVAAVNAAYRAWSNGLLPQDPYAAMAPSFIAGGAALLAAAALLAFWRSRVKKS